MKKSNEPIRQNEAMKQMRNFLSVIAFALMGSVMTGCSSENDLAGNQQPAVKDNIVTVTTTVGLGGGDATTRALSATGVKTFEVGDQIALFYVQNGSSDPVKAVATAENISADGKSATFTFELDNPKSNSDIALSYPASFMNAIPNDFYPAFAQDGTLNGSVKANDLGFATGELVGTALPASITLTNPFAVVAFTLKDGKGTAEKGDDEVITGNITGMTIELPAKTYTITREAADGPIYVVLPPISSAINITATGGGKTYTKTLDNKTYAASNFYQQGLLMTKQASAPEGAISGQFTVGMDGSTPIKVYFSKGNLQATYNGTDWTWAFAENQWDYIGNAAGNTSINGNGTVSASNVTVDLFGWVGASSTWTDAAQYGISNSTATNNTNGYGNNASEALKSDWGNTIGSGWRTLTSDEWTYVFSTRTTGGTVFGTAQARYAHATINTDGTIVNGMILFPDGVDIESTEVTTAGTVNAISEYATKCTTAQWAALAAKGCVFLPAAGIRRPALVQQAGSRGGYWSSSPKETYSANYVLFSSSGLGLENSDNRNVGHSVRLVRPVQP